MNRNCEWTGDTAFPIDWNDPAQRQHLVGDAQLAEDLAVRYSDHEFNRLYGYEAHGGLIGSGGVVRACMGRLVSVIEANHDVTPLQIAESRGQRSRLFDTAAAMLFLPLFVLSAIATCARLSRRFSSDRRSVRVVAVVLSSTIAGFLGLQAGQLWLAVWEAVRVRNGHMSVFRLATATRWTNYHFSAIFVIEAAIFCMVATCWQSRPFVRATRGAATFAATMLAAMFADVFVAHTFGYVAVAAVLVLFYGAASSAERTTHPREPFGVLLDRV